MRTSGIVTRIERAGKTERSGKAGENMAVAKSRAELNKDIEEANRAKNPGDGDVGDGNRRPAGSAATTTQNVNQKVDDEAGVDTSQPRRGDGTYPPDGHTPGGVPPYDMNGNRIR